jgi:hypothetical protein
MATYTSDLSITYEPHDDCERVIVNYEGQRVAIGFETDEELAIYLCSVGWPEWLKMEVCSVVRRHRMADQYEVFDRPRMDRAAYLERAADGQEHHGCESAAICLFKFVCASVLLAGLGLFWIVGAGMAWRAWR